MSNASSSQLVAADAWHGPNEFFGLQRAIKTMEFNLGRQSALCNSTCQSVVMSVWLFLCCSLGVSFSRAEETWESVAPLPIGLAGFAVGTIGTNVMVAGGTQWIGKSKVTLATVAVYNPRTNHWEDQPSWARPFAFGPFAAWQARLVAWGGSDGNSTRSDRADQTTNEIILPHPVAYAGSALLDNRLYILGGTPDLSTVARATAQFQAIDLASKSIISLSKFPGGPCIHVALAAAGGHVWAFTGGRWDANQRRLINVKEAWSYNPTAHIWRALTSAPCSARGVGALALDERYILLAGGHRDMPGGPRVISSCFVYDTIRDTYHIVPDLPIGVMLAGLVRLENEVYVLGGEDSPRHRSDRVFRATVSGLLRHAALHQ